MASRARARFAIGLIVLAALLAAGGLRLWRSRESDLPPAVPPSPAEPGTAGLPPPPDVAPGPTAPVPPAPPTSAATPGTPPETGPEQPLQHPTGSLVMEIELPEGAKLNPGSHTAFLMIDGAGRQAAFERALPIVADGPRHRLVASPLLAGSMRFSIDIPGLASGGPFDAVVPVDAEARVGPLRLLPLGTLAIQLDPVPAQDSPVHVIVEPEGLAAGAPRRREVRAPAATVTLPNMAAGRYRLTARAAGRAITIVRAVAVASGATTECRLVLSAEGRLTVTLLDLAGDPPGPCYLRMQLPDGDWLDQTADPLAGRVLRPIAVLGGRCELRELPAGRIELQVSHLPTGPFVALGEVQIGEGDNAPVTLTWRD